MIAEPVWHGLAFTERAGDPPKLVFQTATYPDGRQEFYLNGEQVEMEVFRAVRPFAGGKLWMELLDPVRNSHIMSEGYGNWAPRFRRLPLDDPLHD